MIIPNKNMYNICISMAEFGIFLSTFYCISSFRHPLSSGI